MSFSKYFKNTVLTVAGIAAGSFSSVQADEAKVLKVYTYDSFTSEWGPGPKVETAFEAICGCDLQWVATEDAVSILSRLKLEGDKTEADVALGLDMNLIERARATGLFTNHNQDTSKLELPNTWADQDFLPFDYGHFAFIYDETKLANPPKSLEELVSGSNDFSIILQDPRTSTPGLGFLLWMKSVYGDKAGAAWEKLSKRIVTTTKGWSEAYGMFLEGEADMVLSYTTSPAYHMEAEGVHKYKAAPFSEGHYGQIEVAAKLKNSKHPELADQFMNFLISNEFQEIIPTNNWMHPVVTPTSGLPTSFAKDKIHYPSISLQIAPSDIANEYKDWVDEWLLAVSK